MRFFLSLFILVNFFSFAAEASVNCNKARSVLEILICSNSELLTLNEAVENQYLKTKLNNSDSKKRQILADSQEKFLAGRTQICTIPAKPELSEEETASIITCLKGYYTLRLNSLQQEIKQETKASVAEDTEPKKEKTEEPVKQKEQPALNLQPTDTIQNVKEEINSIKEEIVKQNTLSSAKLPVQEQLAAPVSIQEASLHKSSSGKTIVTLDNIPEETGYIYFLKMLRILGGLCLITGLIMLFIPRFTKNPLRCTSVIALTLFGLLCLFVTTQKLAEIEEARQQEVKRRNAVAEIERQKEEAAAEAERQKELDQKLLENFFGVYGPETGCKFIDSKPFLLNKYTQNDSVIIFIGPSSPEVKLPDGEVMPPVASLIHDEVVEYHVKSDKVFILTHVPSKYDILHVYKIVDRDKLIEQNIFKPDGGVYVDNDKMIYQVGKEPTPDWEQVSTKDPKNTYIYKKCGTEAEEAMDIAYKKLEDFEKWQKDNDKETEFAKSQLKALIDHDQSYRLLYDLKWASAYDSKCKFLNSEDHTTLIFTTVPGYRFNPNTRQGMYLSSALEKMSNDEVKNASCSEGFDKHRFNDIVRIVENHQRKPY